MLYIVLVVAVLIVGYLVFSAYKKSKEKKRLEQKKKLEEEKRKADYEKRRQDYWDRRPQFYAKIPKQNWYEIYKVLYYWQPAPYIGNPKDRVNYREKADIWHDCCEKFEKLTGVSALYSDFRDEWRDLDIAYLANKLNLKK